MVRALASRVQDSRRTRQSRLRPQGNWAETVCILVIFLLIGATVGQVRVAATEAFPVDAIGRLVIDDQRVCTAFVVRSIERPGRERFGAIHMYENWLATAGHCYGEKLVFQQGARTYDARLIGLSGPGPSGFDVMILSFVSPSAMPTLEPAFGAYPEVSDPLMLIGYGAKALMMRVGPLMRYDERGRMEIHSYASRGNSGGPVLIPGTRLVVGIGVETTLDRPEWASSYYCLVAGCAVKPPYIAAHIDKLKGVASFQER